MGFLTLHQILEFTACAPIQHWIDRLHQPIASISTDSRSIQPGSVFVALRGSRFDGHEFVRQTIEQGAMAAVVDRQFSDPDLPPDFPLLIVEDTLQAYQQIGQGWRRQFQIPVIAVTGSVGKTTTKELIAAVLSQYGRVLKTQANYNNEIGVPKTLLELTDQHDYAVIEMGMRAAGEIALLAQIAEPDVAVITNVGTAHIGRLGSEQAIAAAKCELLSMLPVTGIAILNHDNLRLMQTAAQVWSGAQLSYGLIGGDLQGQLLDAETLSVNNQTFPLPLPGRHNALNYLAALAVAQHLGLDWTPLQQGLSLELPQGRAHREMLAQDVILLDETYNAGLESMLASLQLLADTAGQRRIAILGTMKELGDRSPEFHYQVGQAVQRLQIDHLLILADPAESEAMAQGAVPIPTEQFQTQAEVVERLQTLVQPGDRLLFKASRAVGLDQTVAQFRAIWNRQSPSAQPAG